MRLYSMCAGIPICSSDKRAQGIKLRQLYDIHICLSKCASLFYVCRNIHVSSRQARTGGQTTSVV